MGEGFWGGVCVGSGVTFFFVAIGAGVIGEHVVAAAFCFLAAASALAGMLVNPR